MIYARLKPILIHLEFVLNIQANHVLNAIGLQAMVESWKLLSQLYRESLLLPQEFRLFWNSLDIEKFDVAFSLWVTIERFVKIKHWRYPNFDISIFLYSKCFCDVGDNSFVSNANFFYKFVHFFAILTEQEAFSVAFTVTKHNQNIWRFYKPKLSHSQIKKKHTRRNE